MTSYNFFDFLCSLIILILVKESPGGIIILNLGLSFIMGAEASRIVNYFQIFLKESYKNRSNDLTNPKIKIKIFSLH